MTVEVVVGGAMIEIVDGGTIEVIDGDARIVFEVEAGGCETRRVSKRGISIEDVCEGFDEEGEGSSSSMIVGCPASMRAMSEGERLLR